MTRNEQIQAMYEQGGTMQSVANAFGLTKGRVWQILKPKTAPKYKTFPPIRTAADFWFRVAVTANTDRCWEWQGTLFPRGYGKVQINGKQHLAHRLAYQYATGKEPKLSVLHSCDNPRCVNPNHLREGTSQDNTNDCISRNRNRYRIPIKTKTEIQVRLSKGDRVCDIALSLDVSDVAIYKIRKQLGA
jgi:hypothetical protein